VKITKIEHIYEPTAHFRRSKTNWLMYLQWYYLRLVTAMSRQLWTIWNSKF